MDGKFVNAAEAVVKKPGPVVFLPHDLVRHLVAKAPSAARWIAGRLREGRGPIVAFYHHTDVREALYDALTPDYRVAWISGGISGAQLTAAERWFQDGRIDVLLVQTQAGGMGLTLTRANWVVVTELPWTAAALWQAIKRCHRMTQTRDVVAEILSADCWLEKIMLNVVAAKKSMSHEILDPLSERIML